MRKMVLLWGAEKDVPVHARFLWKALYRAKESLSLSTIFMQTFWVRLKSVRDMINRMFLGM